MIRFCRVILFSAAAGAGIVASDLDCLLGGRARRHFAAGKALHQRLCHLLALDGRLAARHGGQDAQHGGLLDVGDHVVKHICTDETVLGDGIALCIGVQPDAVLQLFHRVEVIHPLLVHRAEEQCALDLAHVDVHRLPHRFTGSIELHRAVLGSFGDGLFVHRADLLLGILVVEHSADHR